MTGTDQDSEDFRALGHRFVDRLADWLAASRRGDGPVLRWQEPAAMLASVPPLDAAGGVDPERLLERLLRDSNRLHHPRFVGHQVCPPLPTAALFEAANALLNNGMAVYEMGPVQTAMELRCVQWMAQRLGLPAGADGVLTSGGSVGNLTALLAARQHATGGEAWRQGSGAGAGTVFVSEQAHYCIDRAARVLGLGDDGVVKIAVDAAFRMRPDALAAALASARARGRTPIAVVASACTTATGAFDPLDEIADVCAAHGTWLHVDGAHGASFVLAPSVRDRLRGIERADSVVWDAHKMLLVPALATGVLFRSGAACAATFAQEASYLFTQRAEHEWQNRGHRTLECTKRGFGAVLYAALATRGEAPLVAYLEHTAQLARDFASLLRASPDFELAVEPQCNIVCFRHRPRDLAGPALDAHNRALRQRMLEDGSFYLVQTALPDGLFLRTTLIHPATSLDDLRALLDALRRLAA